MIVQASEPTGKHRPPNTDTCVCVYLCMYIHIHIYIYIKHTPVS